MTLPRRPRPTRSRGAVAVLAAVSAALLWSAACAASAGAVSWAAYRAAAREAAADASRVPAGSPLSAAAVRFPDGGVLAVNPALLRRLLESPAGSPEHRMALRALRQIAAAPMRPSAPPPGAARLDARLRAILDRPAFATARPSPWDRVRAWLAADVARAVDWLAGVFGRLAGHAPFGRFVILVLCGSAVLGSAAAVAGLWRSGFERAERGSRQVAAAVPPVAAELQAARGHLADGDAAAAGRAVYRAAVAAVAERTSVAVRAGWTAQDIHRAARLDARWPAFAGLGELHDRILFDPGLHASAEVVRRWMEEVERWTDAAARGGRSSRSRSPSS